MAGYDAIWLPPPQKGAEGVRDVGFSVYDRFDLGDQDQRGTVRTRYGTRVQVVSLADGAHRARVRVIFDVVMNHNANPVLIENAGVSLPLVGLDGFPDTVMADYHVLPGRPMGDSGAYEVLLPAAMGGGTTAVYPLTEPNPEAPFTLDVRRPAPVRTRAPEPAARPVPASRQTADLLE